MDLVSQVLWPLSGRRAPERRAAVFFAERYLAAGFWLMRGAYREARPARGHNAMDTCQLLWLSPASPLCVRFIEVFEK